MKLRVSNNIVNILAIAVGVMIATDSVWWTMVAVGFAGILDSPFNN